MIKIELNSVTYNQMVEVLKEMRRMHGTMGIMWGYNVAQVISPRRKLLIWSRINDIDQLPSMLTQLALVDCATVEIVNETKEMYLK